MRATRGLFAGLGASGSVCAAGACALLAVSAAIGLDGWPGIGRGELAPRTLVVGTATAPRTQHAGRPSSPAPARILLATEPGVRGPLGPRASRRVGSPATAEAPASAPRAATPVVTAAPRTNDAAPAFATRRPSEPVRRAAGAGGDALTRTGGTLGSAVAPASPAAGQAVGAATKTTGAAAQSAGQAAGDAVDRVLGP